MAGIPLHTVILTLGLLPSMAAGGVAMLTPPAPQSPARRVDRHGDPLPEDAVVRLGSLRFRAPGEVVALAFAPDGKTLAVSWGGGLLLMDAGSGKQIKRLPTVRESAWEAREAEHFLHFSPDGKSLISQGVKEAGRSLKPVARVWELAGQRKPQDYDIGQGILWVGWSDEGQPLAIRVSEEDGALHLHELASGRSRRFACKDPSQNPGGGLSIAPALACAPAGKALAVADNKNAIHVWDTATGRERCTLQPKGERIDHLTFSPDGSRLVTRTPETVQMWDAAKGNIVYSIASNMDANYGPPVFTADGKTLALADSSRTIRFWDAATGKERGRTQEKVGYSPHFTFSPDGKWLATADGFGGTTIHFWNVATGMKKAGPVGHSHRPRGVVFSPDGRRVATGGGADGVIQFWDRATGAPLMHIHRPGQFVRDIALSLDGRSLFSTWTDENVWISDATSGDRRHIIKLEDPDRPDTRQSAESMRLSDDGSRLIAFSGYYSKKNVWLGYQEILITGWDASTRKQLFRRRRPGFASEFVLSADARVLAEPHSEGQSIPEGAIKYSMRLEDVATGESLQTFPTLQGQIWPRAFSADGRLLASNHYVYIKPGKDGQPGKQIYTIRLWEILTAAEVMSLPAADYNGVAFSPDNRLMAVTAPNHEIVVWDLALGRERRHFKGFDSKMIFWLRFSPDGRQLVSSLANSTLLIWDVGAATPPHKVAAEDVAKAWADLAGKDARLAFHARGTLASAPEQAIALLKEHLRPAQPADRERLRRLLADLDSDQFAVREKARQGLADLGELAEPALRKALADKPSLETRRQIQALLANLRAPVTRPEMLRLLRAVAVLEDIGSPAARRVLERLAGGTAEAWLSREAKASLRRLELRSTPSR